jgi:type I restriction enzyme M protein
VVTLNERTEGAMKSPRTVSNDIWDVEGFEVAFVSPDGSDLAHQRVPDYPFQRAARGSWTVANWREHRFTPNYPDFGIEVYNGYGEVVHGKTYLSTVRATYEVEEEVEWDEEEEDEAEDARSTGIEGEPSQPRRRHSRTDEGTVPEAPATATNSRNRVEETEDDQLELQQSLRLGLSQAELESRLWAAANALRGPVDPADFKAYIFPLLFYKRVCDAWDEEHEQAASDYDDLLSEEIEADYHRFVIPEGCHWEDLRRVPENVGVALQRILDRIQQANPETLAGIFGDVAWGNKEKLPEPSLLALLDAFGSLDLSPSKVGNDVLGNAYEYLLKQFADSSGAKAGEFFTPRSVVRLLTRILDPQLTDTVYDPACGSGGMLVEAANEVLEAGGSLAQMRFYGQEINLTTAAIARMNLYLHDVEDAKVLRGDTLRDPKFRDDRGRLDRFDVVIANPPFSLKNWGADVWANDPWSRPLCGLPPASTGDFAWVQHMLASMHPHTGRVGVVMPHGVLFRGGVEGTIRQCLIQRDQLDAVIGLPANLFYSTGIPACLLIFQAQKPDQRKGVVLFVDGSERVTKGRNQNQLSLSDVNAIVKGYNTGETGEGVRTRLVDQAEVKENDWDLNIGRYIKSQAKDTVEVSEALGQLAVAQLALRKAEERLADRLKVAGYE